MEAKLSREQEDARKALADTLVKDKEAKDAQHALLSSNEAAQTAQQADQALQSSSDLSIQKIHKELAKDIANLNQAKEERQRAERAVARAEKMHDMATSAEEK